MNYKKTSTTKKAISELRKWLLLIIITLLIKQEVDITYLPGSTNRIPGSIF
ncbi:MAG: hypothetical protein ACJAUH_002052 [Saprospiraceae bacterium]|jgi:hypothetical protein